MNESLMMIVTRSAGLSESLLMLDGCDRLSEDQRACPPTIHGRIGGGPACLYWQIEMSHNPTSIAGIFLANRLHCG